MADIFNKVDVEKLLAQKNIWFFGDSNMRGMYKDIIWLLEKNTLIDVNKLKGKLEGSFMNDVLIKGGSLHRGRDFKEIRLYKNFKLKANIEFTFLTQCYSNDIQERLKNAQQNKEVPDVVVINSCLWDITRWGPESIAKYKSNIRNLLQLLKASLPYKTRVIWLTTPPISKEPRGGFFIKQIEFLKHTLRFDVMEANFFVSREFTNHGFDVLDIHYHLLLQIHRRTPDGVHWSPEAMRHITNLFLTHLSISWNVPLPGKFKSPLLNRLQPQNCDIASGSKSTQLMNSMKSSQTTSNTLAMTVINKSNALEKRGRKRKNTGNFAGDSYKSVTKSDFVNDVFDYDYRRKKFKFAGHRNCSR